MLDIGALSSALQPLCISILQESFGTSRATYHFSSSVMPVTIPPHLLLNTLKALRITWTVCERMWQLMTDILKSMVHFLDSIWRNNYAPIQRFLNERDSSLRNQLTVAWRDYTLSQLNVNLITVTSSNIFLAPIRH